MNKTPIGAVCNILFDDGDQLDGYYISFSEPPEYTARAIEDFADYWEDKNNDDKEEEQDDE